MRVLVISNAWPSSVKPYAGIYVRNQVIVFQKELKIHVSCLVMERKFTGAVGSVIKYIMAFIRFVPMMFRDFDIVHVHFLSPLAFAGWFYKLVHPTSRLVMTLHGSDINMLPDNGTMTQMYRYLASKADCLVAVGKTVSRNAETRLRRSVNAIISAGVNQSVFHPIHGQKKQFDFIFVGSYYEVKGVDLLLDAINILNRKEVRYCFVGSGPYYSQIKDMAERYNILLMNHKTPDELRGLYNESRFMVLPSRSEGFPIASVEAMYCGTPVIVSGIPQFSEQVTQGVNGLIMENDSSEALADKMRIALEMDNDGYIRMSENAAGSNREHSLENICNMLFEIYSKLLAHSN